MPGADLRCAEFIDDAEARRAFGDHRLIAVGRHAAIAVSALIAGELDHPLARAIDRAFFRARALAPSALNGIDLSQRRCGNGTEKQQSHDCRSHAGKSRTIGVKNQGRWLWMINASDRG